MGIALTNLIEFPQNEKLIKINGNRIKFLQIEKLIKINGNFKRFFVKFETCLRREVIFQNLIYNFRCIYLQTKF